MCSMNLTYHFQLHVIIFMVTKTNFKQLLEFSVTLLI